MLTPSETTISEFVHPENSAMIAVVGHHHSGSKAYMETLSEQLNNYEKQGALIHYEEVVQPFNTELSATPAAIQDVYRMLAFILDESEDQGKKEDLISVYDFVVKDASNWENHDATAIELSSYIEKRLSQRMALRALFEVAQRAKSPSESSSHTLSIVKDNLMLDMSLIALNPSLLTYRNGIALQAVDGALTASSDRDIALLWGQSHVPGLARGLRRRGFQRVGTSVLNSDIK